MPAPTVEVRAVSGVVALDESGHILLVRRSADLSWGLPGGGVEPGETWAEAARRECVEETGWTVRLTGLLGIYSDPATQVYRHLDGRMVHFVGAVFTAQVTQRLAGPDDEVLEVGFFPPTRLPEPVFGPDRPVLDDFLTRAQGPHIS